MEIKRTNLLLIRCALINRLVVLVMASFTLADKTNNGLYQLKVDIMFTAVENDVRLMF